MKSVWASVSLAERSVNLSVSNLKDRLSDYSRLEHTIFARAEVRDVYAVVAGAGALGNEVVKALGLLGVGQVLIVDPDHVQPSDLTRSVFFRQSDYTGRNKASALACAAETLFPDTKFSASELEIADLGFGPLTGASILFSCVDSDLARLEIAYISTKLGLPVCDAGLGTPHYSHGRVSWFPGKAGACFGCKLTPAKRRELLTLWDATIRPCSDLAEAGAAPSTPTMAAIIGSAQVELGLRWMMQQTAQSETFELSLDQPPRSVYFRTPESSSCPFHADSSRLLRNLPTGAETLLDLLKTLGDGACIVLDWPIVTRVRCLDCRAQWAPMRRAAVVRRSAVCPDCGSRSILEQESIRMIDECSPWARHSPAILGLARDHRYTIRFRDEAA